MILMRFRLLLIALIVALAIPAVAMPAVATPIVASVTAVAGAGHCDDTTPAKPEGGPDYGRAIAPHGCIGCLAPFDQRVAITPVLPIAPLQLADRRKPQRADFQRIPETPPPRR